MAEKPCSCIRTQTIVGQEDTPQVGSLLPVGLGTISNGHTPNTRIYVNNSRISLMVIMTYFCHSLPGWCSIYKEPPNDTSADSYLVLASRTLLPIVKILD